MLPVFAEIANVDVTTTLTECQGGDCQTATPCQISRQLVKGRLMVFITVHNLVKIDAVVLIICMFFDFTSLA